MERVHRVDEKPFADVQHVAVAIRGLAGNQRHLGMLHRDGDAEWQQRIVTLLQQHGAPAKHIEAVSSELGSVRYRPEEVAGAATTSALPADFQTAAERGQQILDRPRNK